jgi:uncharacterized protein (DUF58 family)
VGAGARICSVLDFSDFSLNWPELPGLRENEMIANRQERLDISRLMARAERLAIKSRHLAQSRYAGLYKSAFRGQGMEFVEVREYADGDDVRLIDWNVSARSQSLYVKRMAEERERNVLILLDTSGSLAFGSTGQEKFDLLMELGALFILSGFYSKDKVSLAFLCSKVERYIPPAKGPVHAARLIREIVLQKPGGGAVDMESVWSFLNSPGMPRSLVLFLTDFQAPLRSGNALSACCRKHELVAILVSDPREWNLPRVGRIRLGDLESDRYCIINTNQRDVRESYRQKAMQQRTEFISLLENSGADWIEFSTDAEYESKLRIFLETRHARHATH